ncbi:hypothetical protein B5M09_010982 [Aphanomyces astaci]|uniref:Uncharacterized protein n=1 Tax=Aphanomyces astaci TaxID=112090 RepID=A0A3R7XCF7_APHAT|nr:hypothetical protein B5M09_010982 [Aphanomyces astaci]
MHKEEARAFADTLSDEDVEYLKQVARKTCARVASASRMDASSSVTWEPIGHKDGVDIYIGEVNEGDSGSRKVNTPGSMRKYLCGVTYVPASLDDIVNIFHSKSALQKVKNNGSQVVCMNCCQLIDPENSVCTVCIMNGKVDQLNANQANDTDYDDTSIGDDRSILLPPTVPTSKNARKPSVVLAPLPDLDDDSSMSTEEQRQSSEDNNQTAQDYALTLQPPGFFAQLLAAPTYSRRRDLSDAISYVEPDGTDPLYALAVQRLQVAASSEQEATRLAIVNLYYKHVVEC